MNAQSKSVVSAESPKKLMLLEYMADKYSLNPEEFSKTVRATCGLKDAKPEEFAAFLIVAKEYNLNPLLKEIYAFPAKGGGIVPIVSVDGWVNLVSSHGACDGFEFVMDHDEEGALVSATCKMYRKDRKHPVVITEYLSECIRNTEPWKMKHRMLRHKSLIQASRYAFGFSGIYDEDEGRTIAEGGAIDVTPRDAAPPRGAIEHQPKTIEHEPEVPQPPQEPSPAPEAVPHEEATREPCRISGGSYEAWTVNYIAALETSPNPQVVFRWIDANNSQLTKLASGSPPHMARVKTATDATLTRLRSGQAPNAAGEAPQPTGNEMDDTRFEGPRKRAQKKGDKARAKGDPSDPEEFLRFVEETLAAVTDPEKLEEVYNDKIAPSVQDLLPPDQEECVAAFRRNEVRLGID